MKLKAYRAAGNLTQSQFAERVGVSSLAILKYERGESIPGKEVMLRIFKETKGAVTPNDFYDLDLLASQQTGAHLEDCLVTIGLMSGTSMDGIDAALLLTDGKRQIQPIDSISQTYSPGFRSLLKAAEKAVFLHQGDLDSAREDYVKVLHSYLSETGNLSASQTASAYQQLLREFFGKRKNAISFDEVVNRSTDLHASAVEKLLQKVNYNHKQVDLIGYHGQTLFHLPKQGITVQVGDGQRLASHLGIPVVYDFRSNDVSHGGQGAPFAPLYHMALAKQSGLEPVAIVNCGGIGNVTIVSGNDDQLFAFDTGPGNTLIDRFVRNKVGKEMDKDGRFAAEGKINTKALKALQSRGVKLADGSNFLTVVPPKSLDSSNLHLVPELNEISLQDACRTLAAFTAICMVESLHYVTERGITLPNLWVVAGGGWQNPVIFSEFKERLEKIVGPSLRVQHADEVGWRGKALEAEIFAYLAVRSLRKLPLSVPGTTRVPAPLTGGQLAFPAEKRARLSKKLAKLVGQHKDA